MSSMIDTTAHSGNWPRLVDLPMTAASTEARRDAALSLGTDNWENEGGHLARLKPLIAPQTLSGGDVEALEAQLALKESTLAGDSAIGRAEICSTAYKLRRTSGPSELEEAAAAEQMALYGITRIPVDQYRYKDYRYSKLSDAIGQAKRDTRPS